MARHDWFRLTNTWLTFGTLIAITWIQVTEPYTFPDGDHIAGHGIMVSMSSSSLVVVVLLWKLTT